jgi:hypothetical protein
MRWRFNSQPYLVAADLHDRHHNVLADDDLFVTLAGEY